MLNISKTLLNVSKNTQNFLKIVLTFNFCSPKMSKMFPRIVFIFLFTFLSLSKSYANLRMEMILCTTTAGRLATPLAEQDQILNIVTVYSFRWG